MAARRAGNVITQSKLVDDSLTRERLWPPVRSFFGFLSLLLASIGLHGVKRYSVARSTREIGTRMAQGALRDGTAGYS